MIKHQTYIPAFEGSDGGVIEKGLTLPQLAEAMNFYIAYHSEKTANYSIKVAGSGKLVIEQKSGSTIQTSEYWLADGVEKIITITYSNGKDVKLYGYITYLYCTSNQLTYLDVSHNPALTDLNCTSNQLTSLDLSHNPALTDLNCDSNQLTSLDLSHNPALTDLSFYGNQLTYLDASHNPALTYLDCTSNQLTYLDVSHNPALTYLSCYDNQLTSLDVSHNPALTDLICYSNQLTSLDLSYNPALTNLNCSNNQLTSLDLSHNHLIGFDGLEIHIFGNPFWSEEAINSIISQLQDWSENENPSYFYYYCDEEDEEAIYCLTESQIAALDAKGWETENNY